MKLADIDKNFKIQTTIAQESIRWLNSKTNDVFSLYGLMIENGRYTRMPADIAKNVSNEVAELAINTSGGRISFETDSPYVAISVKGELLKASHITNTAYHGFDLYYEVDGKMRFFRSFVPPFDRDRDYDSIIDLTPSEKRKIIINFPLFMAVDELYIGIDENSVISKFSPYKDCPPIVYYGSSITEGGCASRPGNAYQAIVSQHNTMNFINLGFSGSAHGEQAMADYIASLPMSVFVLDYDHNDCGNADVLRERHYNFYKSVRDKNPDIPIIIMSAPYSMHFENKLKKSHEVVLNTFERAKANGDNVYFIDGFNIFGEFRDCVTVDGIHPSDFGMVKIAEAVIDTIKKINSKERMFYEFG